MLTETQWVKVWFGIALLVIAVGFSMCQINRAHDVQDMQIFTSCLDKGHTMEECAAAIDEFDRSQILDERAD